MASGAASSPTMRRSKRSAGAALCAAILAALAVTPVASAGAAELRVTRTDDPAPNGCEQADCSLREAVIAANNRSGEDQIRFADGPPAPYTLARPAPVGDFGFAEVGDLDITDDLRIVGPPPPLRVPIDGNGAVNGDRVLEIRGAGTEVSMSRLTIYDGRAQRTFDDNGDGEPDFARGGGVYVGPGARLAGRGLVIDGNVAEQFGQGGGVFNAGELSLVDSLVRVNDAVGGFGGGIQTEPGATTTTFDSSVFGNEAAFGGGLSVFGTAIAERSAVYDNAAALGGGIRAAGTASALALTNVTLAFNEAGAHGGGIQARGGAGITANAVTIARNTADANEDGTGDAGGVFVRDTGTRITLRNSILAANADSNVFGPGGTSNVADCRVESGATLLLAGYDLLGRDTGCNHAAPIGAEGNQVGRTFAPIDPLLGERLLDRPGQGKTPTLALGPRSPAVDAASPRQPGSGSGACPATDQRAVPRSACDIGAYELTRCQGRIALWVGTPGLDRLGGTARGEGFLGLGGADTIRGRGGNDSLCGGPGRDTLRGGAMDDRLDGGRGRDSCRGGSGNDVLRRCETR